MKEKFRFIGWIFFAYFFYFPRKLTNLWTHFFRYKGDFKWHIWSLELLHFVLDLLLLPEILQFIYELINWNIRSLNPKEKEVIRSIFGKSVSYNNIRINDRSIIAKKMRIAFVSFNIIHFDKEISEATLVHEVVHIWQYHQFGSVYILRSLMAQRSKMGYNYGGPFQLYRDNKNELSLKDYNYEQMGDIIRDAFIFRSHLKYPNISRLYEQYIKFIQNY